MKLLLFMYIFMFPIGENSQLFRSNYIVGGILLLYLVFNSRYRAKIKSLFKQVPILKLELFLLLIIIYSFIIPTLLATYDYSIISTLINTFVNLIIGTLVFGLYSFKGLKSRLERDLVYVFVIQGYIQFLSFLSPTINTFFNNFRLEMVIERGQLGYGGIRGLSISGSPFFGLGIAYGLIIIYFMANWKKLFPGNTFFKTISFLVVLFGANSAARTSMIGLAIGTGYIILSKIKESNYQISLTSSFSIKRLILFCFIIILLLIGIPFIPNNPSNFNNVNDMFERFSSFAFEGIMNLSDSGSISTNSTEVLFGRMYFPVSASTYIFGDGKYTTSVGTYYMSTDAGYMRNILFFGIIGLILLIIYETNFFNWKNKNNLVLNLFILSYILIVHIKGEALGYSIMLHNVLIISYLLTLDFEYLFDG
ncbi:hypothetical protein ACN68H_06960 [Aerococcus viridans]